MFDSFEYNTIAEMWGHINDYVLKKDPDILLGHNILGYDLPYADKNSHKGLCWGRNGSFIEFNEKKSKYRKDKQQQYEYHDVKIHGRDVIDTFFLSMKYDIGRDFPSYGLKAIEKHLGLSEDDRSWDFQKWPVKKLMDERRKGSKEGISKWNEFKEYCADDSDSPIKLFDIMIPAFFYLTQSVPKTLQQVIIPAPGSKLDSLMLRSYLQSRLSLPRSSKKEPFEGAISMGVPGLYNNVRKVDVASLYPSIMLEHNIYDKKKDPHGNQIKILKYFTEERLNNKAKGKAGSLYHQQLSDAQKIVINSYYGFMGANFLLFNFPAGAAEVTRHGREILLKGVEWATGHTLKKVLKEITNEGEDDEKEKYEWVVGDKVGNGLGYHLVNVDTDSFSYSNNLTPNDNEFAKEIVELNSLYPDLIKWEDDGIFDKVLVIKAKNYVLVQNGKIKYKGASIRDQKKEPILRQFINEFIDIILDHDDINHPATIKCYNHYCQEALNIKDINDWCVKKTITDSVLNPKRSQEQKALDASNEAITKGIIDGIQEGDKIWIYSAIDGEKIKMAKGQPVIMKKTGEPKMVPNTINRFPQLWNNKDHNQWHYVERVWKTTLIFQKLINMDDYIKYSNKKNRNLLESL
jgi:DNA polymerase elongation subunit (family B)